MCFENLSEWKNRIYGVNGKWEIVPDCGACEGEGPFSESLSVWLAHEEWSCQKMSEANERVYIYAVILRDTWDNLQKGSNDT